MILGEAFVVRGWTSGSILHANGVITFIVYCRMFCLGRGLTKKSFSTIWCTDVRKPFIRPLIDDVAFNE